MQDAKDEVRSRLNIEDVIGEYVQLKRAGRNFKGLSPFTSEKTPSFVVSPDKHIWHDFSSGKGGDVFSFVMEVEGLDFRAALEQLARKAGVDLSLYQSKGNQDAARRKTRLRQATELAVKYYQHSLIQNKRALGYVFKDRGLDKQVVQDFKIGYAPTSSKALVEFLSKKGFSGRELADAGLTNRFGGDLFRGRMTVPLMDSSGQAVGFTARTIDNEDTKAPKYLNTPQTLLYDKSRHVFGLSQAKEAIRQEQFAVIVEGNLDVVSSHQAGVKQVVATAGTAMTEHHLRALKRLCPKVKLAFDGDKAGLAAAERAIPIASQVGVELTIVSLPEGAKDPDELIQRDVNLWEKAIRDDQPAIDWLLKQYAQRYDLDQAAGKRQFTSLALEVVNQLNDSVEQEHYQKLISQKIGTSLEAVKAKQASLKDKQEPTPLRQIHTSSSSAANPDQQFNHFDTLLGMALENPATHDIFKDLDASIIDDERRQAVIKYIQSGEAGGWTDVPPQLRSHEDYVKIITLRAEKRYAGWSQDDLYFETANLLRRYQNQYRKQSLEKQILEAEQSASDVEIEALRHEYYELIKEIKRG